MQTTTLTTPAKSYAQLNRERWNQRKRYILPSTIVDRDGYINYLEEKLAMFNSAVEGVVELDSRVASTEERIDMLNNNINSIDSNIKAICEKMDCKMQKISEAFAKLRVHNVQLVAAFDKSLAATSDMGRELMKIKKYLKLYETKTKPSSHTSIQVRYSGSHNREKNGNNEVAYPIKIKIPKDYKNDTKYTEILEQKEVLDNLDEVTKIKNDVQSLKKIVFKQNELIKTLMEQQKSLLSYFQSQSEEDKYQDVKKNPGKQKSRTLETKRSKSAHL